MAETMGPETLRALARGLRARATQAETEALLAHAASWEAEQETIKSLAHRLAEAEKRVGVLEQDRKWWQDNALKRAKRSAARRSGGPPRGSQKP